MKYKYYIGTRLLYGVLSFRCEICENMLQLKRLGLAIDYFAPRVKNILPVMRFYHILHENSFGHL